jgi:hypothetical protein
MILLECHESQASLSQNIRIRVPNTYGSAAWAPIFELGCRYSDFFEGQRPWLVFCPLVATFIYTRKLTQASSVVSSPISSSLGGWFLLARARALAASRSPTLRFAIAACLPACGHIARNLSSNYQITLIDALSFVAFL